MKLKTITVWMVMLTLFSNLLGFLRESGIAYVFGTSIYSDAYYLSAMVPDVLSGWVAAALTSAVLPIYKEYQLIGDGHEVSSSNKQDYAIRYAQTLLTVVSIVLFIIMSISLLFGREMFRILAHGFSDQGIELTYKLYIYTAPSILFIGMLAIVSALLNAHHRFLSASAVGIAQNVILLAGIALVMRTHNIVQLSLFYTLAMAARLFIQVPSLLQTGILRSKWQVEWRHPGLKRLLISISPILFGLFANQINFIVDRMLATGLPEGSVSALYFANKVIGIPQQLFAVTLATALFPRLTESAVLQDSKKFHSELHRGLGVLIYILLPISIMIYLFREPLIRLLFEHGAFNQKATALTAAILGGFSFGLVFSGIGFFLIRAFNARLETKIPAIVGFISAMVNIVLSIWLVKKMGAFGLAISNTVSFGVNAILLWGIMSYKIMGRMKIIKNIILEKEISFIQTLIGSVIMYVCMKTVMNFITFPQNLIQLCRNLLGAGLLGILIYFFATNVLSSPHAMMIKDMIVSVKSRLSKKEV